VSLAQAEARREELVERTISLSALASAIFDECVLVGRLITLNREHTALVEQLQSSAEASYQVGGGAQRASLSAELERAELERERNALIAREGRALAELNGLLHRPASASLPPLSPPVGLPPLPARAKEWQRDLPALRSAEQEVSAQKSALALAERAHLPDLSVGLTYSSMWSQPAHQLMLGASLTLPVQREAKRAKVAEKAAALAQAEARLEALSSSADVSVQRAWVTLREARQEAQIISEQLLPTARRLAQEAESAYVSARGGLADVLAALRQLKRLERTEAEVQARAWQRYATLQRALGHLTLADEAVREGVRAGGDS
jgi:outer membrane protein TolC